MFKKQKLRLDCAYYTSGYIVNSTGINNLKVLCLLIFFFSHGATAPSVGQGLLIVEASRSHTSDTPHSVGLLWTSDQLVAKTST
jgi:hypothetical protein